MNKGVKVSAIIPFYNGVEWLYEAVDSVLNQTYKNVEIIVVNDGSPEDVSDFLTKYRDKIQYFYQENQGVAVARNLAISKSTGKYVALLDSDDIWLPDKVEKQLGFMEETGCMWSHTAFYYWEPTTNGLVSPDIHSNFGDVFERLFVAFRISTPSVMINKQCFAEHPEIDFPKHMRRGQDTGCFIQLAKYYPLGLVNQPLMKIRLRGSNTNMNALIRIKVNDMILSSIEENKNGIFDKVSTVAICIKRIYRLNGRIISWFTRCLGIGQVGAEKFAKCLWVFPYLLERIYTKWQIFRLYRSHKYENLVK